MNRTTVVSLIIVVGAALIGGAYFMKQKGALPGMNLTTNSSATPEKVDGKKVPFLKMVQKGESKQCTLTQPTKDGSFTWTVYTKNAMARGLFVNSTTDPAVTNVLLRDGSVYVWSSRDMKGYKADPESTSQKTYFNEAGDYTCQSWNGDDTTFAVPASVTFK